MSGPKTHSKKTMAMAISVGAALLAGALMLWFARGSAVQKPSFEQTQAEYVQPEVPVDRSKSIALPGWSNFTIPAYTKDVAQGFEFHNPAENRWYESALGVKGAQPEKLVVDSGDAVSLEHYLALAGKKGGIDSVVDYDAGYFDVFADSEGTYQVKAVGGFEGEKTIEVQMEDGTREAIRATCSPECYYMAFALYLAEGDELLYQSGLVEPGKYLQRMELARPLEPGAYDAYVVCQPYLSDQETKTNQGVVRITLNVQ